MRTSQTPLVLQTSQAGLPALVEQRYVAGLHLGGNAVAREARARAATTKDFMVFCLRCGSGWSLRNSV